MFLLLCARGDGDADGVLCPVLPVRVRLDGGGDACGCCINENLSDSNHPLILKNFVQYRKHCMLSNAIKAATMAKVRRVAVPMLSTVTTGIINMQRMHSVYTQAPSQKDSLKFRSTWQKTH